MIKLYSVKYNYGKKTCHTKPEFKSILDFYKLMELQGENMDMISEVELVELD